MSGIDDMLNDLEIDRRHCNTPVQGRTQRCCCRGGGGGGGGTESRSLEPSGESREWGGYERGLNPPFH